MDQSQSSLLQSHSNTALCMEERTEEPTFLFRVLGPSLVKLACAANGSLRYGHLWSTVHNRRTIRFCATFHMEETIPSIIMIHHLKIISAAIPKKVRSKFYILVAEGKSEGMLLCLGYQYER